MPFSTSSPLLIGEHPLMQKIEAMVRRVSATDATILLTGESGTGKELVARALHNLSPRAAHPFVPVNCAALPEDLLESELFGHVRGAFTGALSSRVGMFQLADGGTILLDEVGEMPLPLQAKLLRVLQNHEVRPVGSDQSLSVNIRVIASTNKDLQREVEKSTFREDLFYRLQVIPIPLPPLRARRSDVPLLVRNFLEKNNRKYNREVQIAEETLVYLWEYDWPGNVRELENLLERLVVLNETNVLQPDDLPSYIRSFISEKRLPQPQFVGSDVDLRQVMEQFESRLIEEALRRSNGNKSAAAQMLGLKRTTLVAKLRKKKMLSAAVDMEDGYSLSNEKLLTIVNRSLDVSSYIILAKSSGRTYNKEIVFMSPEKAQSSSPSSATVLVVDDNKDMVEILTRLLSRYGLQALHAYSGSECLDIVRHQYRRCDCLGRHDAWHERSRSLRRAKRTRDCSTSYSSHRERRHVHSGGRYGARSE